MTGQQARSALCALVAALSLPAASPRAADPGVPAESRPAQLRASAFGATGDGRTDDGPALQRAIDAAIAMGGDADVLLEEGATYRLAPQANQASALLVRGARRLALSGRGATLLAHPSNGVISVFDCRDVTIRDLVIDHDPLPFTQARLTDVLPDQQTVHVRIEPGYDDPTVGDDTTYRDFKNSDAVFLDGETRLFTHQWGRVREIRPLGPRTFAARFHGSGITTAFGPPQVGDFIAIKRPFPMPHLARDGTGRFLGVPWANVYVTFSRNVRIERVTSHAAPSMTFVASGSEGVTLEGCRVVRKPGTDRLIAGNSDGAHFKSLTIMPQVHECAFEALMDDSINIRVSSEVVREVRGSRVRLEHGDTLTDDLVIEPGDVLTFTSGADKRHVGRATVVSVDRVGYRAAWVTLEQAVGGLAAGDLAFLQPRTEAGVSHCEFQSQLKAGLLACPPTLVSHCRFHDLAYGVHAAFLGTVEGPPPHGLRISDCEFAHPAVAAISLYLPTKTAIPVGSEALRAERCRITMSGGRGLAIEAAHQRGITLRDVHVRAPDGRDRPALMRIRGCTEIHEENVVVAASP